MHVRDAGRDRAGALVLSVWLDQPEPDGVLIVIHADPPHGPDPSYARSAQEALDRVERWLHVMAADA